MADQWYLSHDEKSFGPYTWDEIVSFSKTGHLKPQDQLWSSMNNRWMQADQISGLFPSQTRSVPMPPSPPPLQHVPFQYSNIPKSSKAVDEKFCQSCGAAIKQAAEICPKCGVRAKGMPNVPVGGKQRLAFILLGLFLGCFGIHNFYAGYTTKGVIQLVISLTLGWVFGLGFFITAIWAIIEIIVITTDVNGEILY